MPAKGQGEWTARRARGRGRGRILGAEVGQIGRGGHGVSFVRDFLGGSVLFTRRWCGEAEADEQTEGGGDKDGPGIGGEAEEERVLGVAM